MNFITNLFKISSFGFLYSGPVYALYKNGLLNFTSQPNQTPQPNQINANNENEINKINKFTNDIGRGYILYFQNLSNIHKFINYDMINKLINELINELYEKQRDENNKNNKNK